MSKYETIRQIELFPMSNRATVFVSAMLMLRTHYLLSRENVGVIFTEAFERCSLLTRGSLLQPGHGVGFPTSVHSKQSTHWRFLGWVVSTIFDLVNFISLIYSPYLSNYTGLQLWYGQVCSQIRPYSTPSMIRANRMFLKRMVGKYHDIDTSYMLR